MPPGPADVAAAGLCIEMHVSVSTLPRVSRTLFAFQGSVKSVKVAEMRCSMQGDRLRIDFTLQNSADKVRRVAYRFVADRAAVSDPRLVRSGRWWL